MRTFFLTGATGFLGAYTVTRLLAADPGLRLTLLVRSRDTQDATARLWRALQLHLDADAFRAALSRLTLLPGDLHAPGLGLDAPTRARLVATTDAVLHLAGASDRQSAAACFNTDLRGTLGVLTLARAIADARGLGRYAFLSSAAVSGRRPGAVVHEDTPLDWERADDTTHGRAKRLAEHMARELLPEVPKLFFRPTIVMGDARFPETTQRDMVRAFCALADLPALPLYPEARLDIVNADWASDVMAELILAPAPAHDTYHLSAGAAAQTTAEIARAVSAPAGRPARFVTPLARPFKAALDLAHRRRSSRAEPATAALLKTFLPDITGGTVFDNTRAVRALGRAPTPFGAYCAPLYRWAKEVGFRYPYAPLPPAAPPEAR